MNGREKTERVVREVFRHKDEKSFRRYIKLAESYKQQVIQEAQVRKIWESVAKQINLILNTS